MSQPQESVKIERVSRRFGDVTAVEDLTLTLGKGEIMGFLGANGAGKTTTIKMLLGLVRPTSGTVEVMGGDPSDAKVRAKIGYMPEVATYYPYLNARELLAFYGGLCGLDGKTIRQRTDELLETVGLAEAAKRPLKTYSKGMLQRAGIAQALLNDPDLLVLDEPFTGVDAARITSILASLRRLNFRVFLTAHEESILALADRIIALESKG